MINPHAYCELILDIGDNHKNHHPSRLHGNYEKCILEDESMPKHCNECSTCHLVSIPPHPSIQEGQEGEGRRARELSRRKGGCNVMFCNVMFYKNAGRCRRHNVHILRDIQKTLAFTFQFSFTNRTS